MSFDSVVVVTSTVHIAPLNQHVSRVDEQTNAVKYAVNAWPHKLQASVVKDKCMCERL